MQNFVIVTQMKSVLVVGVSYVFLWSGTVAAQDVSNGQSSVYSCERKVTTVVDRNAERSVRFQKLVSAWKTERGVRSSITEVAMCAPYQEIVGMGPDVVPLILAQLQSEGAQPDQWFWALKLITRADPVNDGDRGNFQKMSQSWLAWATQEGYVW
jgi:hypothetical protein